jgi:hypothetical protein
MAANDTGLQHTPVRHAQDQRAVFVDIAVHHRRAADTRLASNLADRLGFTVCIGGDQHSVFVDHEQVRQFLAHHLINEWRQFLDRHALAIGRSRDQFRDVFHNQRRNLDRIGILAVLSLWQCCDQFLEHRTNVVDRDALAVNSRHAILWRLHGCDGVCNLGFDDWNEVLDLDALARLAVLRCGDHVTLRSFATTSGSASLPFSPSFGFSIFSTAAATSSGSTSATTLSTAALMSSNEASLPAAAGGTFATVSSTSRNTYSGSASLPGSPGSPLSGIIASFYIRRPGGVVGRCLLQSDHQRRT